MRGQGSKVCALQGINPATSPLCAPPPAASSAPRTARSFLRAAQAATRVPRDAHPLCHVRREPLAHASGAAATSAASSSRRSQWPAEAPEARRGAQTRAARVALCCCSCCRCHSLLTQSHCRQRRVARRASPAAWPREGATAVAKRSLFGREAARILRPLCRPRPPSVPASQTAQLRRFPLPMEPMNASGEGMPTEIEAGSRTQRNASSQCRSSLLRASLGGTAGCRWSQEQTRGVCGDRDAQRQVDAASVVGPRSSARIHRVARPHRRSPALRSRRCGTPASSSATRWQLFVAQAVSSPSPWKWRRCRQQSGSPRFEQTMT